MAKVNSDRPSEIVGCQDELLARRGAYDPFGEGDRSRSEAQQENTFAIEGPGKTWFPDEQVGSFEHRGPKTCPDDQEIQRH